MSNQKAIDLDEFEAKAPIKNRCWHSRLSDDQRGKVDAAKGAGYSGPTIAKVVTDWGVKISGSSINAHYSDGHNCE